MLICKNNQFIVSIVQCLCTTIVFFKYCTYNFIDNEEIKLP